MTERRGFISLLLGFRGSPTPIFSFSLSIFIKMPTGGRERKRLNEREGERKKDPRKIWKSIQSRGENIRHLKWMDLGGYKSGGVEEETGGSAREGGTYFGPGGKGVARGWTRGWRRGQLLKVDEGGGGVGGDGGGGGGGGCRWCWRFKGDILNGWFPRRTRGLWYYPIA